MNTNTFRISNTEEGIQIVETQFDADGQFIRADDLGGTYNTEAEAQAAIEEMVAIDGESEQGVEIEETLVDDLPEYELSREQYEATYPNG